MTPGKKARRQLTREAAAQARDAEARQKEVAARRRAEDPVLLVGELRGGAARRSALLLALSLAVRGLR